MDTTFYDLSLAIAPGIVMTPRAASENLVREAVARIGGRPARVADVGTGSGALAVAIAVAAPEAEVWATDVNATAVRLAAENAERHGVADRVHAVEASLLDGVPTGLDLVLANLPYLPERLRGQTAYDDEPWRRATVSATTGRCSTPRKTISPRTVRSRSSSIGACMPPTAAASNTCAPRSRATQPSRRNARTDLVALCH